jgi:hypothetical protein
MGTNFVPDYPGQDRTKHDLRQCEVNNVVKAAHLAGSAQKVTRAAFEGRPGPESLKKG